MGGMTFCQRRTRLSAVLVGLVWCVATSIMADQPTKVEQISHRYLERLLHVYGEDGIITMKGLQHMLLDISEKNEHRHLEHHHHSLYEQHSADEHVDHDHANHDAVSAGPTGTQGEHTDHTNHDHNSHMQHADHDAGDHSSHADHTEHDHSLHMDHANHTDLPDHEHSSHVDHDHSPRSENLEHADYSNYTEHTGHDHSDHTDHGHSDHNDHDHSDHTGHDHSDHTDHGHSDHNDHDHSDHTGHDHSDHTGHNHGDHTGHDHSDHTGHDHSDHTGHNHGDHTGHDHDNSDHTDDDHSDHAGHYHSKHAGHGHSEHAVYDHSNHTGHDHGEHAGYGHDNSDRSDDDHSNHAVHDRSDHSGDADHDLGDHAGHDHERGQVSRDGPGASPLRKASRLPRALQSEGSETATVPYSVAPPEVCPALSDLLAEFELSPESRLSGENLSLLCPALVYRVSVANCREGSETHHDEHRHHDIAHRPAPGASATTKQWLFAGLSVLCISLCGLAGVAVVPIMQRVVYRQLLQFLVALAVGTLAGDALLHLLPHALTPHKAHSGDHDDDHGDHGDDHSDHGVSELDAVLKGMVALVSVLFFFVAERAIGILHGTCTRAKTQKIKKRLAEMRHLNRETTEMIGQRISSYRHSTGASHCFADADTRDVLTRLNDLNDSHGSCDVDREAEVEALTGQESAHPLATSEDISPPSPPASPTPLNHGNGHKHASTKTADATADGGGSVARESCERFSANERVAHSNDFTVIIHEHEHRHHGHTHTHGHIHQPPGSAAAVAGMVIVGDGLHNFTDGMAIGAAFAAGLASGLSTSVAVFCHELPHEIGDFAVLLQSGMSVRQALFYNVVSSVLCLLGMVIGMLLGNLEAFSSWVFAAAAGSFLYIALVDMIPELTAGGGAPAATTPCGQLTVQLLGMCCGAGIMLAIAIYEHDLHSLVTVL